MPPKETSIQYNHQMLNLIRYIYISMERELEETARGLGLTFPQQHVLWLITAKEGSTLSELSKYGLWHISTVLGIVNRLKEKGLVYKQTDLYDARVTRVYLTEEGRKFRGISAENPRRISLLSILYDKDEEGRENLKNCLYEVVKNLGGEDFSCFLKSTLKNI